MPEDSKYSPTEKLKEIRSKLQWEEGVESDIVSLSDEYYSGTQLEFYLDADSILIYVVQIGDWEGICQATEIPLRECGKLLSLLKNLSSDICEKNKSSEVKPGTILKMNFDFSDFTETTMKAVALILPSILSMNEFEPDAKYIEFEKLSKEDEEDEEEDEEEVFLSKLNKIYKILSRFDKN